MRSGLGRIETILLILLVLGGAALTFVYLYRSREDARRVDCLDRMRQIATAAHNYHDSHKRMPAGTLGNPNTPARVDWENGLWKDQQCTSSINLLIPFMELGSFYRSIDKVASDYRKDLTQHLNADGERLYQWFGDIPNTKTMAQTKFEYLTCPAGTDAEGSIFTTTVVTQPVVEQSNGNTRTLMSTMQWSDPALDRMKSGERFTSLRFSHANYLACYGAHRSEKGPDSDYDKYGGAMTVRQKITLDDLTKQDGLGHTFMYGETIGEIIDGKRTRMQSWAWGGLGHGFGDFQYDPIQAKTPFLGDARNASVYGFGSMHPYVVNFAMCDASARSINRIIDIEVYRQLCGRNDGGPID